ncbi:MAG: hypothetical protein KDC38_00805 [Planctomycetes bacterium]|nr:hypothetical protein [Planctomycetota bacterium]
MQAPKKVINLASLRVYFDQLGAILERDVDAEPSSAGNETRADDLADVARLRYLIALYLVRKRNLIWSDQREDRLFLQCRATDSVIEVSVPPPGAEMTAATEAFDQLFG